MLDNWGWCNASKNISTVSGVRAGSSIVVGAVPEPAGAYSGEYPAVVGTGNCSPDRSEAWSYFNGVIIVVPEDVLPGNR